MFSISNVVLKLACTIIRYYGLELGKNMSTKSSAKISERVPRADKLNLLRDILHLLKKEGGIAGRRRLFYETKKNITQPEIDFSVESTFKDYLAIGNKLTLIKTTLSVAKMSEKGRHLVEISRFGERRLCKSEKKFFRSLLLAYHPFRIFLSAGFCEGRSFDSEEELYRHAKCPKRETLMKAYMEIKGQDTDREARTLLGWGIQIGLIELDEYSRRYYLTREKDIEIDSFLAELHKAYLSVRDPRTRTALIPEVRFHCCCSANIKRSVFDSYLMQLYEKNPSEILLGKGSASRADVLKFGVKDKTYYYYYIKMSDVWLYERQ